MKYKLLILDIDGTVVRNQITDVSSNVIRVLRKASSLIEISFCTGRTNEKILDLVDSTGLNNSYHILESGTKALNPKGIFEYVKSISLDDAYEIVKVAGDTTKDFGFCIDGKWDNNLDETEQGTITNVAINSSNPKQTEKILKKVNILKSRFNIAQGSHISNPNGAHIMITNKEADKEFGIKYIQKKLGIKKEEAIGVGDMPNDLPLFKSVGLKIAMGNAHEELKKEADYIAPSVEKDGLVDVIEKFIL